MTIVEYGEGKENVEDIRPLIDRADRVIRQALQKKGKVLEVSDGKLRALGIAGKIRLSKDIELEIIPKMLSDQADNDWKESLFLLAALSKYGNIITSAYIHSSSAYKDSLYEIAGHVLAREYLARRRKPIRQYHRVKFSDYSIDGEIDFDLVFERNPDGFPQERVSFNNINPYNATIQAAMKIVFPYVKDSSVREIINRAIQQFGSQTRYSQKRLKIPTRNSEWMQAYNLAYDIVSGMGSSLINGEIMSPSFIVDTWRIWQWLIAVAFQIGLHDKFRVIPQDRIAWGQKIVNGKSSTLFVNPDVAIYSFDDAKEPVFLVDAKYKGTTNDFSIKVNREDIYEAFAFCHASGAKKIFLAYPVFAEGNVTSGSITNVSEYRIKDMTISAIKVAFGSFKKQGDITDFCIKMAQEIESVAIA